MTHSSKSSSPYARFIPREEIDAVSAWRFANVDGSPNEDDLPPPPPPGPTPEAIAADMEALRREALAQGFSEGHAVGCEETRQALEAPAREAAQAGAARVEEVLVALREQLAQTQEQMARAVLELACDLARQVIRRELHTDPEALKPVLDEAMEALVSDHLPIAVHLHPDDLAMLEAGWADTPPPQTPRFMPDASLTPGGCKVATPLNTVDATVEKRWQRAVANLGLDTPWESDHERT